MPSRKSIAETPDAKPSAIAWPADKVERRPVASLVPYARNARTHSDAQVAQIAESIKEWGWTVPVLVDEAGMLIAGHGRIMAANLLGLEEVPVMVAVGWTETQKRAYVLADNKLAMNAGWDDELLKGELEALMEEGFQIGLTGFDLEDLSALAAVADEPIELEQLKQPNGGDSKSLALTFGKARVPITQAEHDMLVAALERHVSEYGMTSGFVEKTLNVRS